MIRTGVRMLIVVAAVAGTLWCDATATPAFASGGGAPAHGAEAGAAATRTDILDLDRFRLRSCRPTDQEIVDLQFGVCLVLSSQITPADFHELETWKHRLRDQVIIAVRSAATDDFADPELRRLQRLIMFRVRRLPIATHILGMYLTDFTLDEGELPADRMVLPVTPSVAPKKASGGGGH